MFCSVRVLLFGCRFPVFNVQYKSQSSGQNILNPSCVVMNEVELNGDSTYYKTYCEYVSFDIC